MENTHEHLNDVVMNQDSDLDASEEVEQSLEEAREPEKSDDFSRKFAALSRREKEIRAKFQKKKMEKIRRQNNNATEKF